MVRGEDVYEALGRYLAAAAKLEELGSSASPSLLIEVADAKLAYQNLLDAFVLRLRIAERAPALREHEHAWSRRAR